MGYELLASVLCWTTTGEFLAQQQRVAALIRELGDSRYQARERASAALRQCLPVAFSQLRAAARNGDPEVAWRSRNLLDDYYSCLRPTAYATIPWIDMLPPDYPNRTEIMAKYLALTGRSQDSDYSSYRQATLLYVRDMVENHGWEPSRAVQLMDSMVPHEKAWLDSHPSRRVTLVNQ